MGESLEQAAKDEADDNERLWRMGVDADELVALYLSHVIEIRSNHKHGYPAKDKWENEREQAGHTVYRIIPYNRVIGTCDDTVGTVTPRGPEGIETKVSRVETVDGVRWLILVDEHGAEYHAPADGFLRALKAHEQRVA